MHTILSRGDKVIATARHVSDLDYIRDIEGADRALPIRLDVTESFDQLESQVRRAIDHFGRVDVLVNNAGYVATGVWEEVRYTFGLLSRAIDLCH